MPQPSYLTRVLELRTLEELKQEFRRLRVDKGGIPLMTGKGLLRLVRVDQVPTPAANIMKQELLARGGDLATPWSTAGFDEPLVDVLVIGNLTTLRSFISKLFRQRVFDLPRIADAIQAALVRTTPGYLPVAPQASRQGTVVEETLDDLVGGRIPLEPGSHRATGRPTLAILAGRQWRFGEQTYILADHPDADIHMVSGNPKIVSAFPDTPGAPVVLTCTPGPTEAAADPLAAVARRFRELLAQAEAAGVADDQTILHLDGRQAPLCVIRRLRELATFGRPLLVTPPGAGAAEEAAAGVLAMANGADFLWLRFPHDRLDGFRLADRIVRGVPAPES